MKLFTCGKCGQALFFENTRCERCGVQLGYELLKGELIPVNEDGHATVFDESGASKTYRYCANAQLGICNWLVSTGEGAGLCQACSYNRTIPDLGHKENVRRWQRLEYAKHRLIYSLHALEILPATRLEDPQSGLAFDFVSPDAMLGGGAVTTGHSDGIITIDITEADDVEREKVRLHLDEPYRTLLGHFRHEIGHWYWPHLVKGSALGEFRQLFGDETLDYQSALEKHYGEGPPADWQQYFVTSYASSHPWEDFAETWAHFLHITDALETAAAFRVVIDPENPSLPSADLSRGPYCAESIDSLLSHWLPLTYAVNSLNRSMGQPDLYPFVLSSISIEKLEFVLQLARNARSSA